MTPRLEYVSEFWDQLKPQRGEHLRGVSQFTEAQRRELLAKGMRIVTFSGKTIEEMRKNSHVDAYFDSDWKDPRVTRLPCMSSEVAFDPNQLLLPQSSGVRFEKQLAMIDDLNDTLSKDISGLKVVVGTAADIAELIVVNVAQHGSALYGQKDRFQYTSTVTPVQDHKILRVGGFQLGYGFNMHSMNKHYPNADTGVTALIVPERVSTAYDAVKQNVQAFLKL